MEEVCRPAPNETCTFGLILNTECNLKTYTRRVGLYSYADLQNENKELLLMRRGPKTEVQESATICFHHEKLLLSKYSCSKKTCCNPFKNHKITVKTGLRQISIDTAKLFNECVNTDSGLIKPGQKSSTSCRSKVMDSIKVTKYLKKISMKKNPSEMLQMILKKCRLKI
jgi:hypothetical protein